MKVIALKENHSTLKKESKRPPALPVRIFQSLAPVKVRLAPDPRLVGATHIGFHGMNTAQVPRLCNPSQERADRNILPALRVAHLKRDCIPEIFSRNIRTFHGITTLHECDKPLQDIDPPLLDPDVHIRCCGRNTRPEYPAAEPALLTGFFFGYRRVHKNFHSVSGRVL